MHVCVSGMFLAASVETESLQVGSLGLACNPQVYEMVQACPDVYCCAQSCGHVVSASLKDDSRVVSATVLKRDGYCLGLHFHYVCQCYY